MSNKVKTALGKKVILFNPQASYTMQSGLRVPGQSDNLGIVQYIGPDVPESSGLKKGQRVIYGRDHQQIKVELQDALSMEYENIIAVLED